MPKFNLERRVFAWVTVQVEAADVDEVRERDAEGEIEMVPPTRYVGNTYGYDSESGHHLDIGEVDFDSEPEIWAVK